MSVSGVYTPEGPQSPIHWSWITLIGPDAQDFLHRLTTVHVKGLTPGSGAPGCWLSGQGKLLAHFVLWCCRPGEYAFEFDAGANGSWKKRLLELIDRYTFGEKITVAEVPLSALWLFPDSEALAAQTLGGIAPGQTLAAGDGAIRLCHHGETDFGRPWLTAWGRTERLAQWLNHSFPNAKRERFETLEGWRIQAVRPWVDHELTENTLPPEAGLVESVSGNKGCYPGQEVVERIATQGSPTRRLALIEGSGEAPSAGSKVLNLSEPAMEVGEITSVVRTDGGFRALGFVRKLQAKEGFEIRLEGGASGRIARVAPYA